MLQNFPDSLKLAVLPHEGGFVNDPHDPGGATNEGVTQHVYDNWRTTAGLPLRSVKLIEDHEVEAIYKRLYWDACSCSLLPDGIDYAVFDFAVNSGPYRACSILQFVTGAPVDGHVGKITLGAVAARHPREIVTALCDARVEFLKTLKIFPYYKKGWLRRVSEVETAALVLAAPE